MLSPGLKGDQATTDGLRTEHPGTGSGEALRAKNETLAFPATPLPKGSQSWSGILLFMVFSG